MKNTLLAILCITSFTAPVLCMEQQPKKTVVVQVAPKSAELEKIAKQNRKRCCQRPTELAKKVLNNPIIVLPIAANVLVGIAKILTNIK